MAIMRLAARTHSTASGCGLRAEGVSRDAIAVRRRIGWMSLILPNTYAVGPHALAPTSDMLRAAGVLHAGPGAFLSGPTAGAVLGVWLRGDQRIHVTAPRERTAARSPFVFHRQQTSILDRPPVFVGGHHVMNPLDLCADLARTLHPLELTHVMDRARYEEFVTNEGIDALCEQFDGVPFVSVLRAARDFLRSGSAGFRSDAERLLHGGLVSAGIAPTHVNVRGILGVPSDESDFVWLHRRLNVEVDGRQHGEPEQRVLDAARDELMRGLGVAVLRIRARDVHRRLGWAVAQVRAALQHRE